MSKQETQEKQPRNSKKRKPQDIEKISSFQGCNKRKDKMEQIKQYCREELPKGVDDFVNELSYNFGLTPRKIKEDYLGVLISVGWLQMNKAQYELGMREKEEREQ